MLLQSTIEHENGVRSVRVAAQRWMKLFPP